MIRVADYIAQTLVEKGITEIFMVVGGAAMHLNDAMARRPELRITHFHHEQACAMAAESYFRLTGRLACVCVSSGPGSINALTGVHGAWTDSMGMLVLSGQVRTETLMPHGMRQLGDQEVDIISMVEHITKYAVEVSAPVALKACLEHAIYAAVEGRPGPVWLSIPIDIQGMQIDLEQQMSCAFIPTPQISDRELGLELDELLYRLRRAKRPVVLLGSGLRTSPGAMDRLSSMLFGLAAPVVTAFNAHDLIASDHPQFCGRAGTIGDRAGNIVVQNSDFLLILGCRLNIRQIGYNRERFAPEAVKIMVDIDENELHKPTLDLSMAIQCDLKRFVNKLWKRLTAEPQPLRGDWYAWCRSLVEKYPVVLPEYKCRMVPLNPYHFVAELFKHLDEKAIVVTGNATACITTFQAANIKMGQRLYSNSGSAAMGWGLPAAIGAARGAEGRQIICIDGDGSLQLNLQELSTIMHNNLPIILFVLENGGYNTIRQSQTNHFGRLVGCDPSCGLEFPRLERLARAFSIPFTPLPGPWDLELGIDAILERRGPLLVEVFTDREQSIAPRVGTRTLEDGSIISKDLDDMDPPMPRESYKEQP